MSEKQLRFQKGIMLEVNLNMLVRTVSRGPNINLRDHNIRERSIHANYVCF